MIQFELEGTLGEGDHDVISLESLRLDHGRTGFLVVGDGLPRDNPPIPTAPRVSYLSHDYHQETNGSDRAIVPGT